VCFLGGEEVVEGGRERFCNTFEANFAIKFGSLSSLALFADRCSSHNQQSKVHVFVVVVVVVIICKHKTCASNSSSKN
jgi:hypothetical protein